MRLSVPMDYVLARDLPSYGYFLLAPNHWDPSTRTFSRALSLPGSTAVHVRVSQPGRTMRQSRGRALTVEPSRPLDPGERREVRGLLRRMLRLDEDAAAIRAFHRVDPRWKGTGRGRLSRSPTLFEDVIKTVTSCNVQWPGTVAMNLRLCEVFGEEVAGGGPPAHAFPTPQRLARARTSMLRARCRVGYRDARIVEIARRFATPPERGGIDAHRLEDPRTSDDEVVESLLGLPGVGPYAAANILQLLGRYSRLPLDTESVRHGRVVLGFEGSSAQVMRRVHEHFAPMGDQAFRSYWFELWAYYELRHGKSWTWERDSTGRLFTAANL